MLIDPDMGNPAPGFRLGFPEIQGSYPDPQAGTPTDARTAHLLIIPSGRRVALRQTAGGSNVYESDDASYLRFTIDPVTQTPSGSSAAYQQSFNYDRWGNRVIDAANTWAKDGTVWVEDALPAGASGASDGGDAWTWVSASPTPYSGSAAHQSANVAGEHQHYFTGASQTLTINAGEALYAYVYLDPSNPPSEVMLQWFDGSWSHRAYWGANSIAWGTDNSDERRYLGPLPAAGRWVRLEVPASQVGLSGHTINGMAFTLSGGKATWDRAGKTTVANGGINDKAYSVDAATNRLQAPSGYTALQYDSAGNVSYDGYTNSGLGTHKYDAENKLREVYSGLGALTAQYFYDGDGQRVRRITGGVETWQVYGIGGELLAEYAATTPTAVQKEYGYRGGQLLVVWDSSETGSRQWQWLIADQLGTPRMTVDASGSLSGMRRHDYLPFGEEVGAGVGGRTAQQGYSSDNVSQKFTGKIRDGETGLDYFLARYYSSAQGRFTSPDEFKGGPQEVGVLGSGDPEKQALPYAEIRNPQSLNKYTYCYNNPLRYTDPDGHLASPWHFFITFAAGLKTHHGFFGSLKLAWKNAAVDFRKGSQDTDAAHTNNLWC